MSAIHWNNESSQISRRNCFLRSHCSTAQYWNRKGYGLYFLRFGSTLKKWVGWFLKLIKTNIPGLLKSIPNLPIWPLAQIKARYLGTISNYSHKDPVTINTKNRLLLQHTSTQLNSDSVVSTNQRPRYNIMKFCPVEAAFSVYEDFLTYKEGISQHTSFSLLGGYAVKIIGWGREDKTRTDYWIVASSWNITWSKDGWFTIAFGNVVSFSLVL